MIQHLPQPDSAFSPAGFTKLLYWVQIRVHLADAGHAIIGDEIYGVQVTCLLVAAARYRM